jgi:hypothetical protein
VSAGAHTSMRSYCLVSSTFGPGRLLGSSGKGRVLVLAIPTLLPTSLHPATPPVPSGASAGRDTLDALMFGQEVSTLKLAPTQNTQVEASGQVSKARERAGRGIGPARGSSGGNAARGGLGCEGERVHGVGEGRGGHLLLWADSLHPPSHLLTHMRAS